MGQSHRHAYTKPSGAATSCPVGPLPTRLCAAAAAATAVDDEAEDGVVAVDAVEVAPPAVVAATRLPPPPPPPPPVLPARLPAAEIDEEWGPGMSRTPALAFTATLPSGPARSS